MIKRARVVSPFFSMANIVWGCRTEVQAKRPDPTKKAYALRVVVLKRRFRGSGRQTASRRRYIARWRPTFKVFGSED